MSSKSPAPDDDARLAEAQSQVTDLLHAANAGDAVALESLVSLLYDELRWLAHRNLGRHAPRARSFSTTELVHEAYMKLARGGRLPADSRRYFLGSASSAMRQVLVSEARRRLADKRTPAGPRIDLELVPGTSPNDNLLAVHEALERLSELEPRLARNVECRFFGGLSVEETADVLDTSTRTVKRDWRKARAWLHQELERPEATSG